MDMQNLVHIGKKNEEIFYKQRFFWDIHVEFPNASVTFLLRNLMQVARCQTFGSEGGLDKIPYMRYHRKKTGGSHNIEKPPTLRKNLFTIRQNILRLETVVVTLCPRKIFNIKGECA